MFSFFEHLAFRNTMKLLDKNTELSIAIEAEIDDLVEDITTVYNRRRVSTLKPPNGKERR